MSKLKKPRNKKYQGPRTLIDPMATAQRRAAKLTVLEQQTLLNPVKACFAALRAGTITPDEFKHLADCFNIAQALMLPEIVAGGLLPDHADKFDAAHEALRAIATRKTAGGSWTCYAQELRALETGMYFHALQLGFASANELARATQKVDNILKGARSGSASARHFYTDLSKVAA